MPFTYSNVEYADMVFVYGLCNGSAEAAVQEYKRRYPTRRSPGARVFYSTFQHLRDSGTFPGIRATAERLDQEQPQPILNAVQQSPGISTRTIAKRLDGVTRMSAWRTLKKRGFHPYHLHKVQNLQQGDHARRVEFCNWLQDHPQLWQYILFTDEATFTRAGHHNSHNDHWWAKENPHKKVVKNFQQRFSVNVWCGIIGGHLIGPHIFEDRLDGVTYARFLTDQLPSLLKDVPLATRQRLIFQHDGAPPHYHHQVKQHLDQVYPDKWIGRGGPRQWPARSPDLTPLDYYLWGHMKTLVYKKKSNTREELLQRIMEACQDIRDKPDVLRESANSILKRAQLCIEQVGNHFENLM